MRILNVQQNSSEWLAARCGVITASEADALISPTFKQRDSRGVETYLHRKLAEKWRGGPLPEVACKSLPMEFGNIIEQTARPWAAFKFGWDITTPGFITTDDGRCGCSPDGIIDGKYGLEIKSPLIQTHVGNLLAGVVPPEYLVQCHFSMFVAGFEKWHFLSYRMDMPPLVLEVWRDEEIQATIKSAVDSFLEKMDSGWQKLIEINGGKEPTRTLRPEEIEDNSDVAP